MHSQIRSGIEQAQTVHRYNRLEFVVYIYNIPGKDGDEYILHFFLTWLGQFCIPNRALNVPMANVVLDRPGIMPLIGEVEPTSMAEHAGMYRETDTCLFSSPRDKLTY